MRLTITIVLIRVLRDRGTYGIMRLLIESLFEFELQSDMGEDTWKTYIGDHIQASRLAGWRVVLHSQPQTDPKDSLSARVHA